jgi:microcin C transport system permease protein
MGAYILRRLLLMIPTIVGIMAISFAVIQFAPGGPVEQVIAQLTGQGDSATDRISGGGGDDPGLQSQDFGDSVTSQYRGAQGLDPEFIAKDGSRFDVWTSAVIIVGYAIPSFLFAVLLVVLFAGGSFWNIFPLRGLVSDNFADLNWWEKIVDYAWHLVLPLTALAVSSFATMTLLTKNSFLDEIKKQYVMTARAKGLTERRVLYGHVFRNAMLIVIAGFPGAFIGAFFAGSLLIEQIFSLDGLGLLGFEAAVNRDYPVVFATLYIFSLLGLVMNLITDLIYTWIDPRIDFESRQV